MDIKDIKEAYKLLNLDIGATKDEIEKSFRNLAQKAHPDRPGGSDEAMTALNEARSTALQYLTQPTAPALMETIQAVVALVSTRQEKQQQCELRAAKTQEQFRFQSTNKLRRYRQIATVLGALSVVAIFVGKELPVADFLVIDPPFSRYTNYAVNVRQLNVHQWPEQVLQRISPDVLSANRVVDIRELPLEALDYLEELDRRRYEIEKSAVNRIAALLCFVIGLFAGGGAWLATSRIDRVEHELREFEEQTETKTEMYTLLQDILGTKVHQNWTLAEMSDAILLWVKPPRQLRKSRHHKANEHMIRVIGPSRFAQLLLDRAQQIGLVSVREEFGQNTFAEYYSIASN